MLLATLILHVASARPPVLRNLSEVIYLINQTTEVLGFTIKEMQKSKNTVVSNLAGGLGSTEPKVWASILSVAKSATFNGPNFGMISGRTDIPLEGIVRGDPISIYLVLPPEKLDSHGSMLRLWIGCLMDQICKRRHQVPQATLFLLDNARPPTWAKAMAPPLWAGNSPSLWVRVGCPALAWCQATQPWPAA